MKTYEDIYKTADKPAVSLGNTVANIRRLRFYSLISNVMFLQIKVGINESLDRLIIVIFKKLILIDERKYCLVLFILKGYTWVNCTNLVRVPSVTIYVNISFEDKYLHTLTI